MKVKCFEKSAHFSHLPTGTIGVSHGLEPRAELGLEHTEFELQEGHSNEAIREAVAYSGLKFRKDLGWG